MPLPVGAVRDRLEFCHQAPAENAGACCIWNVYSTGELDETRTIEPGDLERI